MERKMYVDCGKIIKNRLTKEINGLVKFEAYPEVDMIVFKITFKDFNFNYAIKDIQNLMYLEGFDDEVSKMLHTYKKVILSSFFKNNEQNK